MRRAAWWLRRQPYAGGRRRRGDAASPDGPRAALRRRARDLMVGEFTCAMCMDILVKSTHAWPCNHAFCEECSRGIVEAAGTYSHSGARTRNNRGTCPTCRGRVEGWSSGRSFDAIVWSVALQGAFDRDDARYYLERRAECGEDPPTELERECILNGGAGDATKKANSSNSSNDSPASPRLQAMMIQE